MDIKELDSNDAFERGKKSEKKKWILGLTLGVSASLLLGGVSGMYIAKMNSAVPSKLAEVYNYLVNNWYYKGSFEDLESQIVYLMINGLSANGKDNYLIYASDYASQGLSTDRKGIYGASLSNYYTSLNGVKYGGLLVNNLINGTFKEAGFKEGDVIIGAKHVDETSYTKLETLSPSSASYFIKPSKDGENVSFEYVRNNEIYYTDCTTGNASEAAATLIDDSIDDNKHIVTIRVSTFLGNVPLLVTNILNKSIEDKGQIDRLVLDMKDNGGGYTSYGRDFTKLFLDKGQTIYSEKNGDGKVFATYVQDRDPSFKIDDIRIILNQGSASATELFSLAMKENNKAKIYGTTSYGKGIEQSVVTLSDESTLRFTTAQLYGPKGDSIHGVGITPDYNTNDYIDYARYLVSTPYMDGTNGYRLTYAQEQNIIKNVNMLFPSSSYTTYDEALAAFKVSQGLTTNTKYDTYTLYRLYGELLNKYFSGQKNEVNLVSGVEIY